MFQRPDRHNKNLYVITPIFNPVRFRSRWKLYKDFEKMCEEAGAILYTIEAAFGERDHAVTESHNPQHIQVRTSHELWLKENLINVAATRLPPEAEYIAWVDADVTFARDDWADETIHQLQHYAAVQMWSQYQDLTPDHELIGTTRSFMECYMNGGPQAVNGRGALSSGYSRTKRRGYPGAPGLAWACRRDEWEALGGLIDICILGAGDWYMAHSLVGKLDDVMRKEYHPRYVARMKEWEARAERHIRRNVGVVKGLALHHWHGPKVQRKYGTRDEILIGADYNPDIDLKRDLQGVYQLSDQHEHRSIKLRDGLRKYFRERNEDHLV